jgi:hypothetical protein
LADNNRYVTSGVRGTDGTFGCFICGVCGSNSAISSSIGSIRCAINGSCQASEIPMHYPRTDGEDCDGDRKQDGERVVHQGHARISARLIN